MTSAAFSTASSFESLPVSGNDTQNFSLLSTSLLDALPLACAIYDKHGQLSCANARFYALIKNKTNDPDINHFFVRELYAQCLLSIEPPSSSGKKQAFGNEAQSQSLDITTRNGQKFTAGISTVTVAPGQYHHLIFLQNFEEEPHVMHRQRNLHARLLHATRAQSVGEMTTILSHELNQPLGAIVNYLDAAQKILGGSENVPVRAKEALRLAQIQAHQAGAVVARIREFVSSRQIHLEACDIGTLIRNALELLQWELQKLGIKYEVDIAEDLPLVSIDSIMLGQVLTNLVSNAIDALQSTPQALRNLWISASLDLEQRIIVRVRDTGAGVSPIDQKNLFKPFFTTKPKGMGIGLSISRSIMELHAGSLYHETNIDCGSSFCFTLPTQ